MRINRLSLVLVLCTTMLSAQNYRKTPTGIEVINEEVKTLIQFYNPNIVRVCKTTTGDSAGKKSLSVIKEPESVDFTVKEGSAFVELASKSLKVRINVQTGKVSFCTSDGTALLAEKDYGIQFTPTYNGERMSNTVRQAFLLDKEEPIYGLGQIQNGKMIQRHQRVVLKQENTKVCIPFFQSVKGYGVFWDNYASTIFNDNLQETSFESLGDEADYYFLYGPTSDGVIACMRSLTGQSPMIPLWSFGFYQSKERYKTQEEVVNVVKKYRELGVPLDCVVQDWRYWGKDSLWNAMSFNPETHPDPQGMFDEVHKMNAKLMIVAWPGFGPLTRQFKDFDTRKMLINFNTWPPSVGAKPYDVYNPAARDLYWDYLHKGIYTFGPDAWWLDSTEPDHVNAKEEDYKQPTYLGPYGTVANAFPLMQVGGVYEHQRAVTSQKRVSILTRSAFAGQQRYAANTWSGDIIASWETLQRQIPAALNFSLTGIPYWNSDIGGFFLWNYGYAKAPQNNAFRELYVRWMQFGTFCPMMRSHGASGASREIYQFGKRGGLHFDALERYIRLRYSLLPYIYSTAWGVTNRQESFMRALFMDYANDSKVWDIKDQYLFGHSFLVAPVVNPMYVSSQDGKGTESYDRILSRSVYLPKGTSWIDFWTGRSIEGGVSIEREAPIDIIPIYVKAGTILPVGPRVQYAEEKRWDNLEIRVYPGADGEFVLYEDENDNYNYEQGAYSTITFHWNDRTHTLTIGDRTGKFKGMLAQRKFSIVMVDEKNGLGDSTGKINKVINYKGKKVSIKL